MVRTFDVELIVAWDGVNWIDESDFVVSASGEFRLSRPADFLTAGGGTTDQATIVLSNATNRYLTYVLGQAFFQRHVRLSVDIGAGMQRIFSGAIDSLTLNAPDSTTGAYVTLNCVTQEGPYLQRKFDLRAEDFRDLHALSSTETDWFNFILDEISSPLTRDFDPGMVSIPWLWADDESILEEFWQASAACGGTFYTNILGHLVYRNILSFARTVGFPTETLSRTANSYAGATLRLDQDNLFSDITVEVSTRTVASPELVWSPEDYDKLIIPPNSTRKVTATFDTPVYSITEFEWEATDDAGYSMESSVSMSRVDYAQKCELTFVNSHPTSAAVIRYFRITGYPVVGNTTFEYTAKSTSSFWNNRDRRNRSVRDNAYIQSPVQAQFLADLILDESQNPRAIVQLSGLPGVPTRFIGDIVTVQDAELRSTDIVGQIEALSWNLTTTYTHGVTVRDFGSIYQYAPYFILNSPSTGTIGGTYRMFY